MAPVASFDGDMVIVFLATMLLPAIAGEGRVILMDNLSAHSGPEVDHLFRMAGHIVVYRPTHSPDFAPIEYVFSWLKGAFKVPPLPTPSITISCSWQCGISEGLINPDWDSLFHPSRPSPQHNHSRVTKQNWRQVVLFLLTNLHPDMVAEFFAECHYFVPGKEFKPYLHPEL